MGQYFKAVVGKEDAKNMRSCKVFSPYEVYDTVGLRGSSGKKLTEHGWIGNYFCEVVAGVIYKNPQRVAWVGDYTTDEMRAVIKAQSGAAFVPKKTVHRTGFKDNVAIFERDFDYEDKVLVNHTTKEYLDYNAYIKRATDKNGWQLDPLAMLTATSNGEGGGDYYGERCADEIGTWAWCVLSIEDKAPAGYKEVAPTFIDGGAEPNAEAVA